MTAALGLLALGSAIAIAACAIVRANRRETAGRRCVLDDCGGLLDEVRRSVALSGHGVLRGCYRGRPAALTPIAESLAFRKLPQLWLSAAVADEDPDRASLAIVRRPTGTEFFAGAGGLSGSFRPPASWPQDTAVHGSPGAGPLLGLLDRALADALADPRLKAVTLGPKGVRVVRQAAQGDRAAYLLFRDQRFADVRVSPADAAAALDLASLIADRTHGLGRHVAHAA